MEVSATRLHEVLVITPRRVMDSRGFFSETYSRAQFAKFGIGDEFVQDNQSLSTEPNVIRGLHYQLPPFAQAKLVRVIRGSILDVAVDIRRGSPSFGQSMSVVINAENWKQVYIPVGFAHGFQTLEPHTEVVYKVSNVYSATHERGIAWDDSALKIAWQSINDTPVLSPRDLTHPVLAKAVDLF